ncbi:MAG: 50S ribosomal protein L23 [Patescibacteria group bacterium]
MEIGKIIKNPRVTEKGSLLGATGAYVFDITDDAGKDEVKKAIFALYKVKPRKVNILKVPAKKMRSRGKVGVKSGGRKAVVYLSAGDKIEFV